MAQFIMYLSNKIIQKIKENSKKKKLSVFGKLLKNIFKKKLVD